MSKMIGGSHDCSICGGYHGSDRFCQRMPRQKAQVAIDNLEKVIGEIGLTMSDREFIKAGFSDLRKCLDIPVEPLYNRWNLQSEEDLDKYPDQHKLLSVLKYNPTDDQKNQAKGIIKNITDLVKEKGQMTSKNEFRFLAFIDPKYDPLKLK